MSKVALITGCTGQDGSYLAEFLLHRDYTVHGIIRRSSTFNTSRLDQIYNDPHDLKARLFLHYADLTDMGSLVEVLRKSNPDEVYHLGAQSHVRVSFDTPIYTVEATGVGTLHLLEAIRILGLKCKFYQAGSSEMFGGLYDGNTILNEQCRFHPRSPYGCAKVFAHNIVVNYRESYGMFAANGILFNHESPRRGETFVTRKITRYVADLYHDRQTGPLYLGNLDARRDWGYSPEYCIDKTVPILTTSGWKICTEISDGDEVINFNVVSNRLERDTVVKKIERCGRGDRIIFEGRGMYLRVTPEHRIFYQCKSKSSKGGWSDWKVCSAKELHDKMSGLNTRTLYDYRFPHFQDYSSAEHGVTDAQIFLTGVLAAEGWFRSEPNHSRFEVGIGQSMLVNEDVCLKIEKYIRELGLNCRLENRNNGMVHWCFDAKSSQKILEWFDVPNIHVLPTWVFRLSQRQCELLFTAMMDCDGCWGQMNYSSKRYKLAVDFQTIAHMAGYRTTAIRKSGGQFVVPVVVKRKKYTYASSVSSETGAEKDVWCISTKNGTIVTRDRDCISISGNCVAMWKILQQERPDDFVIATGETHSVAEFLNEAFQVIDQPWYEYVQFDPRYVRPSEVDVLIGDATKASICLDWKPQVTFKQLVKIMVMADITGQETGLEAIWSQA